MTGLIPGIQGRSGNSLMRLQLDRGTPNQWVSAQIEPSQACGVGTQMYTASREPHLQTVCGWNLKGQGIQKSCPPGMPAGSISPTPGEGIAEGETQWLPLNPRPHPGHISSGTPCGFERGWTRTPRRGLGHLQPPRPSLSNWDTGSAGIWSRQPCQ